VSVRSALALGLAGVLTGCGARTDLSPLLQGSSGTASGSNVGSPSGAASEGMSGTLVGISSGEPSTSGQFSSGTIVEVIDAGVITPLPDASFVVVGLPCPSNCAQLGAQCGFIADPRCGGTVDCGGCLSGSCGVVIPNVCSPVLSPGPDAGAGVVVADRQSRPSYIVVDATNIYWTTYDPTNPVTGGSVMEVPTAGGAPVALASNFGNPGGLAVDGQSVYWTSNFSGKAGAVMKVPIAGGPVVTLVTEPGSPNLVGPAVDGNTLYWSENITQGAVLQAALDGSHATVFASGQQNPGPLAHDAANLYWATPTSIWTAPLAGGPARILGNMPGGPGVESSIAVDSMAVYSAPTFPLCVAWETPIAAGVPSGPVATPTAGPPCLPLGFVSRGVASDGANVYWTIPLRAGPANGSGEIQKVATGTLPQRGPATTIATGQNVPFGIAVDATHVYWTNYGALGGGLGQVMKALK